MPESQWAHKRRPAIKPCKNGHMAEVRVTDGRCVECVRLCHARQAAKKGSPGRWVKQNPEVHRKYRQSDKGRATVGRANEKRKPQKLAWTKTRKGREAAYRANHSEKYRVSRKRFSQTEKGKACYARNASARRARKRSQATNTYTFRDRELRFAEFNNKCAYCGATGKLTEDHVVAISRGGPHGIENIVPCCKSCNTRKNSSDVSRWYQRQDFFSPYRWSKIREVLLWI